MRRTTPRRLLLPVLFLGTLALAACGSEDEPAPTTPSGSPPAVASPPPPTGIVEAGPTATRPGIEFVDGFAAGAEAAEGEDQLLFVYVGRQRPT